MRSKGSKHLGRFHETIFLYNASADYHSKYLYRSYDSDYVENFYKHTELAGNGVLLRTVWDDIAPVPGRILDYNSRVAFNRLTYENIRSHTHYHGDFGLGQRRLG
jgi:hypothetical protein